MNKDLEMGNKHDAKKEYNKALEFYKKAYAKNPNDGEILLKIAKTYLKLKKYQQVIDYCDEFLKEEIIDDIVIKNKNEPVLEVKREALIKLGENCHNEKNYQKAIEYYDQALDIDSDVDLLLKKGNAHFNATEYKAAIDCYKKALDEHPESEEEMTLLENIGDAYYELKKYQKAVEYYNRYLEEAPENEAVLNKKAKVLKSLVRLADKYSESEKYVKAIKYYKQAIEITPSANLWLRKGNARFNLKQYKFAIICYKNALAYEVESEERLEILENLGDASRELEQDAKAIEYYDQVLEEKPEHKKVSENKRSILVKLAKDCCDDANYKEAIDYYTKAIAIRSSARLWLQKGNARFNLGQYNGALTCYKHALAKKPSPERELEILRNMGDASRKLSEYAKAIEYYDQVLEKIPEHTVVLKNKQKLLIKLGDDAFEVGDYAEAITYYERYLEKEPDSEAVLNKKREALIRLADFYFFKKGYKNAISSYQEAIDIKPDANLFLKKGNACFELEDYGQALDCYQTALKMEVAQKERELLLEKIVDILFKQANYIEAISYCEQLPSSNKILEKKRTAFIRLAEMHYKEKNTDKAVEFYTKALQIKSTSDIKIKIGDIYFESCDYQNALDSYEKIPSNELRYQASCLEKMATACRHLNKNIEAVKYYDWILAVQFHQANRGKITQSRQETLIIIADELDRQGNYQEAANYYETATKSGLVPIAIWWKAGNIAFRLKSYARAVFCYEKIVSNQLKPDEELERLEKMVIAFLELKKFGKALSYYQQLKGKAPNKMDFLEHNRQEVLTKLAEDCYKNQQYELAIEFCKEALEFQPSIALLSLAGDASCHLGLQEQAILYYKNALEQRPTVDAKLSLVEKVANCYFELNNYSEAIVFYDQLPVHHSLIKTNKRECLIKLGDESFQAGNYHAANKRYEDAIKISASSELWTKKGSVWIVLGDDRSALRAYENAFNLQFTRELNLVLVNKIIELSLKLNDYTKAIEFYDRIIQKFPYDKDAPKKKKAILLKLGDENYDSQKYMQAIKYYKQAASLPGSEVKIWLKIGDAYVNLEDKDNALGYYKKALEKQPKNKNIQQKIDAIISRFVESSKDEALSDKENVLTESQAELWATEIAESFKEAEESPSTKDKKRKSEEMDESKINLTASDERWIVEFQEEFLEEEKKERKPTSPKKPKTEVEKTVKIKKKNLPVFIPKILVEDFSKEAPSIPFTKGEPKPNWDNFTAPTDQNKYTYEEETEEEKAKRKAANKTVADKIGLWGEKLAYAKLEQHYGAKYNAKPVDTPQGFKLEGRYPVNYSRKPLKSGKQVHLEVDWYNKHSKSCEETTNDHDMCIAKRTDNQPEVVRTVEVKTTRAKGASVAKISGRELDCARHYGKHHRFFRIYNAEENPTIEKFKDPYKTLFGEIPPEFEFESLKIIL